MSSEPSPEIAARLRGLPRVDDVAAALDPELPHGVRVDAVLPHHPVQQHVPTLQLLMRRP